MDPLFERFERILRSYFRNGSINEGWSSSTNDQDFRDAFDELDEFLKTGESSGSRKDDFYDRTGSSSSFRGTGEPSPPEVLRGDYRELGVSFGAPFEDVRSAYRELMRVHHPDRHNSDPAMQERATRRAQLLNTSFHRIRAWEEAKKGG